MIRFEQDMLVQAHILSLGMRLHMDFDGGGSAVAVTVSWPGGTAPTMTATDDKADTYGFIIRTADDMDGYVIGQNITETTN